MRSRRGPLLALLSRHTPTTSAAPTRLTPPLAMAPMHAMASSGHHSLLPLQRGHGLPPLCQLPHTTTTASATSSSGQGPRPWPGVAHAVSPASSSWLHGQDDNDEYGDRRRHQGVPSVAHARRRCGALDRHHLGPLHGGMFGAQLQGCQAQQRRWNSPGPGPGPGGRLEQDGADGEHSRWVGGWEQAGPTDGPSESCRSRGVRCLALCVSSVCRRCTQGCAVQPAACGR